MVAIRRISEHDAVGGWSSDPVTIYLDEIGRHPLLTPEAERELGRTIARGRRAATRLEQEPELDPTARRVLLREVREGQRANERFVNANLRLVVSVAKRYQATGIPLLDLVQEGNLGLIRAVEKFDPDKGFRFSTYAMWWIRQFIARGIAASRSSFRLPSRANDDLLRVREVSHRMEQDTGRPPRLEEIVELTGLSAKRVSDLLPLLSEPVSLSAVVGSDGGAEMGDFVADPTATAEVEAVGNRLSTEELEALLASLDDREAEILRLRFGFRGDPCSTTEIAARVGLSRERVRQLEHRSMSKLLHPSRSIVSALTGG